MATPDGQWILGIVDRYEGPLIRFASRFTGDAERARDVVQDSFMKLCREERSKVEDHVAEWLFTVVRNGALDVRRKERRMHPSEDVGLAEPTGSEADPTLPLERQELLGRVMQLLDTLPASQQEVIRLKFQNGLSYREISQITQRTVNHVGVLLHNGIKTLRQKAATQAVVAQVATSPRVAPGA